MHLYCKYFEIVFDSLHIMLNEEEPFLWNINVRFMFLFFNGLFLTNILHITVILGC